MTTTATSTLHNAAAGALHAEALHAALKELYSLLAELVELSQSKLAAMRAADADALQRIALRESRLLPELVDRQRRRDAVLARLAQSLHGLAPSAPSLTAAAEKLSEPWKSKITAKTEGLRALAEKLRRNNQLAADVARGVQSHIRAVFAAVAEAQQQTVSYARDGSHEHLTRSAWVDAVG